MLRFYSHFTMVCLTNDIDREVFEFYRFTEHCEMV